MATWKKVIVSGSAAQLSSLTLDNALGVAYGGTGLTSIGANNFIVGSGATTYTTVGSNGTGTVVRTTGATNLNHSGSFSGSFYGDGTNLTGINANANISITSDNGGAGTGTLSTGTETLRFDTASSHGFGFSIVDSNPLSVRLNTPQDLKSTASPTFASPTLTGDLAINGSNLTTTTTTFNVFNTNATTLNIGGAATTLKIGNSGSTSTVWAGGNIRTGYAVSSSTLQLSGLPAGTTTTALILDATNGVATRTIDSRVFGSSLIDGAGSAGRVTYWTDADTVTSDANFTYASSVLTVGGSTFGANVTIAGDFTVLGNTTILEVSNLIVEDRFILLNSGSATGDGGIIVQSGSMFNGVSFGWKDTAQRWGFQQATVLTHSSSVMVPEAYAAAVVDVDNGLADIAMFQRNGNVKITGGEIYIYA